MGLFDKKYCDVCGEKIGLLGNRKLADGNMCKDCLKLASPYLTGRKNFSIDDMKEHLKYREENKRNLDNFNVTSTYGVNVKLHIDEAQGAWLISSSSNFRNGNPDIMTVNQVTGCTVDIRESRTEFKRKNAEGKEESYNPPRYDIDYDFYVVIDINSPWYSEIEFKVNASRIEQLNSAEYKNAQQQAEDIKNALTGARADLRERAAEAARPKVSVTCPHCRASTIPDDSGRCEYCGGAVAD